MSENPKKLFKTTIVIWSEFDPTFKLELNELAQEAMNGNAYCSRMEAVAINDPTNDPDWDGTEFFGDLEPCCSDPGHCDCSSRLNDIDRSDREDFHADG